MAIVAEMSNPVHLVRKESSRELRPKSENELITLRSRLKQRQSTHALPANPSKIIEEGTMLEFDGTSETRSPSRETWDNKVQFLLATIGYAVGLGSVWRFPYLVERNGGGAFLIPYTVMLFIIGIPLLTLELAIGQRLRKGCLGVWNQVSPYLGGIGLASCFVSVNVAVYYNTIIAWCLYYLGNSLSFSLPWFACPTVQSPYNGSNVVRECEISSPTQYFWYRTTLDISDDINHPTRFNPHIAICLVLAWTLTYLCMAKGIASSGKVVYVTATFPYIVLIIFFVRGVTLKGMELGLKHLFTPDFSMLMDPVMWLEAGTQIFFSFGLAFGGLIAFSSYNPPDNNCVRDAVTIGLLNAATALFASIVVFSVLGFKAVTSHEKCMARRDLAFNSSLQAYLVAHPGQLVDSLSQDVTRQLEATLPVCDLTKELEESGSGTGLAFIVFTEAINQFPLSPAWAVLFFLMLFTLGIDSEFGTLEGVITCMKDFQLFPNLRKEFLTGIVCVCGCAISMIFANGSGNYIFILFDNFSGNVPLLIIAIFETIAISWVYGLNRFASDIQIMTGSRPHWYWLLCWKYLSPCAMIVILIASVVKQIMDGAGYEAWDSTTAKATMKLWPSWAWILIVFLVLISAIWVPVIAITRVCKMKIIPDEEPAWFPVEELKEAYNITEQHPSPLERRLFCLGVD